jgi:hypothetical protein
MWKAERSGLWTRKATESLSWSVLTDASCVSGTARGDTRIRGEFGLVTLSAHFGIALVFMRLDHITGRRGFLLKNLC